MRIGCRLIGLALGIGAVAGSHLPAEAEAVQVAGQSYASWADYFTSQEFRDSGGRCATPEVTDAARSASPPTDCSHSTTVPRSEYNPGSVFEIPVVVHLITNDDETQGFISDTLVHAQIDVINEDFLAVVGSSGADGTDTAIRFKLAVVDPDGLPTNGITRTADTPTFNDLGEYWTDMAWNPKAYCNVYVNNAAGGAALGYVPFLPADGQSGTAADRIVIHHASFGRPATGGAPYNLGRTLTHEIGHYLGLFHTFDNGCGTSASPVCYSSGDNICDTESEDSSRFQCQTGAESCESLDPIHNYMDYSDDSCMNQFTPEQTNRMRCSLMSYRGSLYDEAVPTRSSNWRSLKQAFR